MKKITRSQRRNIIEIVKTVIIIVLCVCCVHFMFRIIDLYRVQSDEQGTLWGDAGSGYLGVMDSESVISNFRSLSKPQMIMVDHSKGKYVLNPTEEDYSTLNEVTENVIRNVHMRKKNEFKKINEDDWRNALDGECVYVKFECAHNTAFEAGALSVTDGGLVSNISAYSEIILIPYAANDELSMLIREQDSGNVYSVSTHVSATKIKDIIKKIADAGKKSHVFASELNMDKGGENRVSLDSLFLIPVGEMRVNNVISRTPKSFVEGIDFTQTSELSVNLINAFGYNHNTIRQYSDGDGKLIYVGETGTIALSADGQVEYKALTDKDGIPMMAADGSKGDAYSIVAGLSSLNKSIFRISGVGNEKNYAELRFSDFPDIGNKAEIRVVMDYYVNNCRIEFGSGHAVEAVVKNGILVEYKIRVKTIEKTVNTTVCNDILKAVDDFCLANPDVKKIAGGKLVYRIAADEKETSAVWKLGGTQ